MTRRINVCFWLALGLLVASTASIGCRTAGIVDLPLTRAFAPPPMLESSPEVESLGEPIVEEASEGISVSLGDSPRAMLWTTNYEEALARAASEGKLVLAFFTGSDFCQPCQQLNREVLETTEFETWAQDRFVLLELDYPRHSQLPPELGRQNQELIRYYGVKAFPTVLTLSPQGDVVAKISSYRGGGPQAWTQALDGQLSRFQAD